VSRRALRKVQQASDDITSLLARQEAVDVLRDHHLLMGHDLQWDEKRSSEEGSGQILAYESRQQLATT